MPAASAISVPFTSLVSLFTVPVVAFPVPSLVALFVVTTSVLGSTVSVVTPSVVDFVVLTVTFSAVSEE